MERKQLAWTISSFMIFVICLGIYFLWIKNPLTFVTYPDLTVKDLKERDYLSTLNAHNECFDPDKRKYLNRYLREVKYPETSEPFAQMLKERVERYIEKGRIDKLKSFRSTENVTLVKKDEAVIGLYNCHLDNEATDGSVMIFNVCVLHKERGQGFGKKIMEHAIDRCSERGKDLTLTVYRENKQAIDLYKKLGFEIVPVRKQPEDEFFLYQKYLMKLQSK